MAIRPVFEPVFRTSGALEERSFVREHKVEFTWYPGFSVSQARKSVASLHTAAKQLGLHPLLEISTKSPDRIGFDLSALNLKLLTEQGTMSVEAAYQGSKVFENGGPFTDLYQRSGRACKRDARLRVSGRIIAFKFGDRSYPSEPDTAFYDWLYAKALTQNQELAGRLRHYAGFTDIAFNPKVSRNCQARAAAIYVAMRARGLSDNTIGDWDRFLALVSGEEATPHPPQ